MSSKRGSLKRRVAAASFTGAVVLGCLLTAVHVHWERAYRLEGAQNEIRKSANFIEPQAYQLLKKPDRAAVVRYSELAESIVKKGDFLFVEILDAKGRQVVPLPAGGPRVKTVEKGPMSALSMGANYVIRKENYDDVGSVLEGVFAVMDRNKILGYIVLGIGTRPIEDAFYSSILMTFALLVLALCVSGFLAWKAAQKSIQPVLDLAHAVETYRDGDSLEKFDVRGASEVALLGGRMKALLQAVRSNEEKMKREIELATGHFRKNQNEMKMILSAFRKLSSGFGLKEAMQNVYELAKTIVACREVHVILSASYDHRELIPLGEDALRGPKEPHFLVHPKPLSNDAYLPAPREMIYDALEKNDRRVELSPGRLACPLISAGGQRFGLMILELFTEGADPFELDTLQSLMEPVGMALDNLYLYSEVEKLATHDAMTGLLNQQNVRGRLLETLRLLRREKGSVFVILSDIDKFKLFNDTYGHLAGDKVIRTYAQILKACVKRQGDHAGRNGGEEFLVILRNLAEDEAAAAAGKIQKEVRSAAVKIAENQEVRFTVSFGVAGYAAGPESSDPAAPFNETSVMNDLLEKADKALYHSKRAGRDRCTVWTPGLAV